VSESESEINVIVTTQNDNIRRKSMATYSVSVNFVASLNSLKNTRA